MVLELFPCFLGQIETKRKEVLPTEIQDSLHREIWIPKFGSPQILGTQLLRKCKLVRSGTGMSQAGNGSSPTLSFHFSMDTKSLQTSRQEIGMELWHIPEKLFPQSHTSQCPSNPSSHLFCHKIFLFSITHPKITPT